jgi:hypothetical protein
MFLVFWFAKIVKHLAETSHGLKTRPGRPHIPSQTFPDVIGDKTVCRSEDWGTVLRRRRPLRQRNGRNGVRLHAGGSFFAYSFGVLAQLGERLICIQEVRSSILLGSTKF